MSNVVDGFTLSTTLRLIPTLYRAHMYEQMEILRRAGGYKARYYTAPDTLLEPIPAYGQLETQVRAIPGTYVWGLGLYLGISLSASDPIRIQITDTSTEIPLFSDYIQAILMQPGLSPRSPSLLAQPRLITDPGQLNVEMYNDNSAPATVQLVIYCAEPILANPDIREGNHYQKYERLS